MALKVTTKFNGVVVQNAYAKVNTTTCNKTTLAIQVYFFASASETMPFKMAAYEGQHNLEGENAIKQAYKVLKTLPEFADAQDC